MGSYITHVLKVEYKTNESSLVSTTLQRLTFQDYWKHTYCIVLVNGIVKIGL
jgi:hypothetical protein